MTPGLDALSHLALHKVKVKFIPAQKEVGKALTAAARLEGLPRDEIDELAVPLIRTEEAGRRRDEFGDYIAELVVDGPDARLQWSKRGKAFRSVPCAAKKEHAEKAQELQSALKDVGKMLTAQCERIDGSSWRGRRGLSRFGGRAISIILSSGRSRAALSGGSRPRARLSTTRGF